MMGSVRVFWILELLFAAMGSCLGSGCCTKPVPIETIHRGMINRYSGYLFEKPHSTDDSALSPRASSDAELESMETDLNKVCQLVRELTEGALKTNTGKVASLPPIHVRIAREISSLAPSIA